MAGRKQDSVWLYYAKLANPGKTGCRAKCKQCGKVMQGLVTRMKQHQSICSVEEGSDLISPRKKIVKLSPQKNEPDLQYHRHV